ncbi:MAG: GNAT family N-acetyltransferase [gamma proteobacterium symbiont of Lucinoma myriamae]|nr:GNAT family N-acetyltransferase [gamma proteobacterium symbiont of Lucinoma myriamae]MCU7819753.1 GNAT family N-acetyltransferase [gamma proteobacterium symbiont of Lucinoma myriamae]MCU7833444.1 GNAT family N-acetyltransferase [gamma proteobacterium symbiont of Lucinoma myriamae]
MGTSKHNSDYYVQITHWTNHSDSLKSIREQVFIQEQNVPVELEWDGLDDKAIHILAETVTIDKQMTNKKLAIGTARITLNKTNAQFTTAHIGRMAVLAAWRGQSIGSKILQLCIDECKRLKATRIILNAQVNVIPFYQKAGFEITSEQFLDADIPHKQMTLVLLQKKKLQEQESQKQRSDYD